MEKRESGNLLIYYPFDRAQDKLTIGDPFDVAQDRFAIVIEYFIFLGESSCLRGSPREIVCPLGGKAAISQG
jgi:hypothetical protein